MKKLSIFLLSLLCTAATAFAYDYDFKSGDLYYNITGKNTVEVTSQEQWSSTNYRGLTTATIPETVTNDGTTYSVTSIGEEAFSGCDSLTSIVVESSNRVYDSRENCNAIIETATNTLIAGCQSTTIPNSVTSIGKGAFAGFSSLTSVTIPNSVTSIGNRAFSDCSSLTSVTIPNSVTSIGNWAFSDCSSLTSITIPNSVKTIREGVFNNNVKLAKVTIGTSVETIEANAFAGCRRLYDIYCYPTYPPLAETNSFANYNVYVYVPCENQRDYTLDVVWGEFKFIECIGSEVVVLPDDEVTVAPSYEDVTITWPSTDGAETYSLVITKGDITFCTLVFNAQGQLVSIAFKPRRENAPAEEGTTPATYAEMTANGFRFKVTGLDEGTDYAYTLTVRNAANSVLETYTGEFTTQSDNPMGIQESAGENTPAGQAEKILRNGQVLILRNCETYDMMGQML